ncbi:MAG: polysaccharide biosynthesis/export family protein [Steroidobacteraceae bacterium]
MIPTTPMARLLEWLGVAAVALMLLFARVDTAGAQTAALPAATDAPLMQLGTGDELKFQVFGQPDMDATLYIADDGSVTIPLAGNVKITGLSLQEAGIRLETALRNGNFLLNPHVTLTVLQSRSQRVSVLGEVKSPGRYTVDSSTTLFDLLAQAGGVNADGATTIYLIRPDETGKISRFPINLRGLSNNKFDMPVDSLKSGDSVYVPKADQFYIFGEVGKAGQYSIEPDMNVLQAIAKAGGISQRGSLNRVEIKRRIGEKKYKTFSASVTEVVQADDVIQIKESIF